MIGHFLEIWFLNLMYNLSWASSSTKIRLSGIFKGARCGFDVLTVKSGGSTPSQSHVHGPLLLGNKSGRQFLRSASRRSLDIEEKILPMAATSFFKCLARPQSYICKRCIRNRNVAREPRRAITQNFLRKTYEAELEWKAQAVKIKAGEKQNMMSILEERGFVKDIAGYVSLSLNSDNAEKC